MKAIRCDLPYAEQIEILPMADLHIGDSQCDYKLVLETIEYILADLASIVDSDIYIHAHTHLPAVFRESFFRVNSGHSSVAQVEKLFINCAAALNYGGYGDKAGFKPASKKMPVLYLNGVKHDMWAKI